MPTIKYIKENPYEGYLSKLSKVESGNNPNARAKTSSALGLYQFTESTWKSLNNKYNLGYSLDDRFDPVKSKKMAEILTRENETALKNSLGRDINDGERYLGHFLGTEGSKKLLKTYDVNPNTKVGDVVSSGALSANKSIFFNKDGSQKTVADVYNWASKKMGQSVSQDNQTITNDVNYLSNNENLPNFAGVPYIPQQEEKKTEVKDKDIEEVQQKTNELNFLDELKTRPIVQEQNTQQQAQAPQYQTPNYIQLYDQISQFTENPVAQQGRQQLSKNEIDFLSEIAVKDNNGYWNKNNHGKVVEIEGNIMATHGYGNMPLYVIPDKGSPKIVHPNTGEHVFKGATKFIEIPIKK